MPRLRRATWRRLAIVLAALFAAAVLVLVLAVWTNAFGVGERFGNLAKRIELIVDPPPDRPIEVEVRVTPPPTVAPTLPPSSTIAPDPSAGPTPTPAPTPTPTPVPQRVKVDVNLYADPEAHFITEVTKDWCAVSGTQMVLAAHGKAPLTEAFQRQLASRIGEWESRRDSLNGDWGPAAIVLALEAYGVTGYEIRAYETRADALRDAAHAISAYGAPVLLMAWRGAHTWVMTGYRADADPLLFPDARVSGAYILDPWYPRVSSIWGPSDPPGTYQDAAEMRRNFLPWKRPEGKYPTRDGLYLAIVPTQPLVP